VEGEGNIGASSSARGLRVFPREGGPETVPVESADPWGPEIEYFVSCLGAGRHPEQGTGEQARLALLVSLAANRSLESGRPEAILMADDLDLCARVRRGAPRGCGRASRELVRVNSVRVRRRQPRGT
jgi:hypothetical protein